MTTDQFLATCSTEEFQKHLSTLDRDGIDKLRQVLADKAERHRRYSLKVNRTMEQLEATLKHLDGLPKSQDPVPRCNK